MQTPPADVSTDQSVQTNSKPYRINTLGIEFELFPHTTDEPELLSRLKDILVKVSNNADWDKGKIRKKQRPGVLEPRKTAYFPLQIPESELSFEDFGVCRKQIAYLAKQASAKVSSNHVSLIRPVVDYNHKLVGKAYSPRTKKVT